MNTKNCFKQTAVLLAMFLVSLCVTPEARAQSTDGGNIYVRVFSFDSEIKEITNGLTLLNSSSAIDTFFNSLRDRYTLSTKPGTLLYRAVQTGLSYLKADEMLLPEPEYIIAVNLITFTDGIDQGSTTPNLPPVPGYLNGDSLARMTPEESREYLKRQFNTLEVRGKPITGYSIGLMGTDVDPANQHLFADNLNAFNSEEKNFQGERQSVADLRKNFSDIGGKLYEQTRTSIMTLEIPAPNPGTRVRWTFDIALNNNSSAAAAGSMRYLEGDYGYDSNDTPLLQNIRYGGDIQSADYYPGSTITGRLNGMMVQFEFSKFSGTHDTDIVREWLQISGSPAWQTNVEFDKKATEIIHDYHYATVIYMVLDSSKSMGGPNIELIKESVAAALEPFGIIQGSPAPTPRTPAPTRTPAPAPAPSGNLTNSFFLGPLLNGDGFGVGLGYERAFADPFSIAFNVDFIGAPTHWMLDFLIKPRWYPLGSAVGGWYLGATLGYGIGETTVESYYYDYYYTATSYNDISTLVIGLETGYKFVFFEFLGLEPYIGFTFADYGGLKIGVNLNFMW